MLVGVVVVIKVKVKFKVQDLEESVFDRLAAHQ